MPNYQAPGLQDEEFRAGGELDRSRESAQAWRAAETGQDYWKGQKKAGSSHRLPVSAPINETADAPAICEPTSETRSIYAVVYEASKIIRLYAPGRIHQIGDGVHFYDGS